MCRQGESETTAEAEGSEKCNREHAYTEYRNNAKKVLQHRIDSNASEEVLYGQIKMVVGILCPFLQPDSEDRPLRIKPLTGGLSNHLYLVSNSDFSNDAKNTDSTSSSDDTDEIDVVLVRINSDAGFQNCENIEQQEHDFSIVDRDFESKFVAWLASQREDLPHNRGNMAPTMYGRFENGTVEEFYKNIRPLVWAEMVTYAPWIARSMASLHSLDSIPEEVLPRPPADDDTTSATIYNTICIWMKEAYKMQLDDVTTKLLNELSLEWDWLKPVLFNPTQQHSTEATDNPVIAEALDFIRRSTITHMDCQPLNILISNKDSEENCDDPVRNLNTLRLIDFEYSGWNPIVSLSKISKQVQIEHRSILTYFFGIHIHILNSHDMFMRIRHDRLLILRTHFVNIAK